MKEITKEELVQKLMTDLTEKQLGLINFNIYYNSTYLDYYMNYNSGEYTKCYDFIKANVHLLDIKYTPKKWVKIAKKHLNIK